MTGKEFLVQHGISQKTATKFDLTWDENYLNIPIKDEHGHVVWIKQRNLNFNPDSPQDAKYKNSPGSQATLFNLHAVKDAPNIVICEGEADCIKLDQEGVPAVSSTGGAETFPREWAKLLEDKVLWICYDNDKAGKRGVKKLLEIFPDAGVITLPDKDVCDFFASGHGREDFMSLVVGAQDKLSWEMANIPEDFSLMAVEDFEKLQVADQPWLIDGVLYSEGFCFIYGAEGTGKSFITLSMGHAIAQGKDWLGCFKTKKTNVLFLDKENPSSILKRRIEGLGINSGDSGNMYWLKYPEKFQLIDSKSGYSEFATALTDIITGKGIGLVVIDSFVDFMVGNESSAGDTQAFFDAIRQLYPGIAYLTVHHENKPSQGIYRNDSQRLRGSTNINAQTVTMFRLEPVAKSKTELTLKQTKTKDAQKLDKFMVRMEVRTNPDKTTSVTGFTYLGSVVDQEEDKLEEATDLVVSVLSGDGFGSASRKSIIELASGKGIPERTLDRAIKKLSDDKALNKVTKGREVWLVLTRPIVEKSPNETFDGGLL